LPNIKSGLEYIHKKNFINSNTVSKIVSRLNVIESEKVYPSIHDHIIELTPTETSSESLFNDIRKKIELFFNTSYELTDLKLTKLWLSSSTSKHVKARELPYIPHFDKQRYMKAMVYLHSVTKNHGPIYLGKAKNAAEIERRRNILPADYKTRSLNTIEDKDLEGSMNQITGSAGDVIFFDTNTPHKAGILKEGYKRRVLRFDFELDGFNEKKSFTKRLLKKLINR